MDENESQIKSLVILLSYFVWKYGDASISDDEIETHSIEINEDDLFNFSTAYLNISNDNDKALISAVKVL